MTNISFNCPSCGGTTFRVAGKTEVHSYKELVGATCQACGYAINDNEVEAWALKLAREQAKKAFGKFK